MKVFIELTAWNDSNGRVDIGRILHFVEDGWHIIDFDPGELEESWWFKAATSSEREFVKLAAVSSSYCPVEPVHQTSLSVPSDITMLNLIRRLSEPVRVFVENKFTDGLFIYSVARCFGRSNLCSLIDSGAIQIEHIGGIGEIQKFIEFYQRLAKKRNTFERLFVLIDGDCRFLGDISSTAAAASIRAEKMCRDLNVMCHRLKKRAIENYIPDEALTEWVKPLEMTNTRPLVHALRALTDEQRNFFPIKDGLPKSPTPEEYQLYGSVDLDCLRVLARGLGDDFIIKVLSHSPSLIESESFSKRVGDNEIELLLDEISKLT